MQFSSAIVGRLHKRQWPFSTTAEVARCYFVSNLSSIAGVHHEHLLWLPGGSIKAASLHVCRTVCRRAERAVVAMAESEAIPELTIVYLNRLSDLLFTLARLASRHAGVSEETW